MPTIILENITKTFGSFNAVSNLNLTVEENKVFGFLGPNGAGKTTTIRMMVCLSKPTSGSIHILNEKIEFNSINGHQLFGYLPELPSIYPYLSATEFLSFVAELFHIQGKEKDDRIKNVLKLVGLSDTKNKKIGSFSGGMKQRLGIAQVIIHNPKVLILDEPVSALDPIGRKEVLEVIQELKKDRTIFMSTHILADVDRVCDDVAIINNGKLITQSSISELKAKYANPILEVMFLHNPSEVKRKISQLNWVKNIEQESNSLRIWIKSEDIMRDNTPLKELSKFNIGILSYGLKLPAVEDLFVQLIGEDK